MELKNLQTSLAEERGNKQPGPRNWAFSDFHPECPAPDVLDVGGQPHVYCRGHRVLRDVATVGLHLPQQPLASEDAELAARVAEEVPVAK